MDNHPALAASTCFALVNGQPLEHMPDDLYIPPDALKVFLTLFEGPLDLLLYLIKRQNLDILNIPIAQITEQYIAYIQLMSHLNLELAADYLVMAALLAEIKSALLLPRPEPVEEEEEDPRATLIRRLQDYECIKNVADELDLMPRLERELFCCTVDTLSLMPERPVPDVQLSELLTAFHYFLQQAENLSHHHITKEPLSVRERMSAILAKLKHSDSLLFSQLFLPTEGRAGLVVAFLALLELSKERLIDIIQPLPFDELRIKAAVDYDI
jgi:segregation and condensation protein A